LSGGINPAPQKRNSQGLALQELAARLSRGNPDQQRGSCPPDAASVGNSGVDLWGRLYAGRRRRVATPEGVPASVGRDKPGPTKRAALGLTLRTWRPACRVEIQISNAVLVRRTRLRSGTRESTCGAGFTPADGAAFPLRRVFPRLSAGINPAPQKRTALGLALQELAARLSRGNPDQQPRLEQRERHQAGHGEAQAAVLALEPGDALLVLADQHLLVAQLGI